MSDSVSLPTGSLCLFSPLGEGAAEATVMQSFEAVCNSVVLLHSAQATMLQSVAVLCTHCCAIALTAQQ